MNYWSRIKRWWSSCPARWRGTHLDEGETLTQLGIGATFEASKTVADFYAANEGRPIAVRALRLVESQPETVKRPVEVPEDNYPIG